MVKRGVGTVAVDESGEAHRLVHPSKQIGFLPVAVISGLAALMIALGSAAHCSVLSLDLVLGLLSLPTVLDVLGQ